MMDDDGPNFSYAFGGTSAPATQSWNPALRPNHDDAIAAASPPKPSESFSETVLEPAPSSTHLDEDEEEDDDEDDEEEEEEEEEEDDDEEEEEEDVAAVDSNQVASNNTTQHPPQLQSEVNGHGSRTASSKLVQDPQLDELVFGDEHEDVEGASFFASGNAHDHDAADPEAGEEHGANNYEHQGETTLLEDAVAESTRAPLVQDAAPTGDDWGASGEVFDLGGKLQDAPLPTPTADAVGTNVGDQVVGSNAIGGNTGDGIDWGDVDDQDLFGTKSSAGAHIAAEAKAQPEPAADSAWDLALDDDFLEDNSETVAPFELDDDEGFLEDEDELSQPVQDCTEPYQTGSSTMSRYAPQTSQAPQAVPNAFGGSGPQFTDFSQMNQSHKPMVSPNAAYNAYTQPARPVLTSSAESFAAKSKGGYHSPYDLPDDVVTTRKRPAHRQQSIPAAQVAPPPPRSSSHSNVGAPRAPPPSNISTASLSPPSSSHSMQSPMSGMPPTGVPKPPARSPSNNFFEELPITHKPKPPGRYTPQPSTAQVPQMQQAPPHFPSKDRAPSWSSQLRNEVLPDNDNDHLISQLQQPERLPTFPDHPSNLTRTNSLPVPPPVPVTSRYSPAPPTTAPASNARYSPAPPAANARYSPAPPPSQGSQAPTHGRFASEPPMGPPRPPVQPYAPRTSSPLAFHHTAHNDQQHPAPAGPEQQLSNHHTMLSADGMPRIPHRRPLEGVSEMEEQTQLQGAAPLDFTRSDTPPLRSTPSSTVGSPRKTSSYMPHYQSGHPTSAPAPPPRAQSQSPGATMKKPLRAMSYGTDRPASAHNLSSTPSAFGTQAAASSVANIIPHKRQSSLEFQYIAPTDERAGDALERWKGYPIFTWGMGGTVITSFPKQIPRYGGGSSVPMMKCSPGEVRITSIKEASPLPEEISKFPGPLKSKAKKKDVSAWLTRKTEALESHLKTPGVDQSLEVEAFKRLEEKVLLYKVIQILVDNDGHLEYNATAEASVRKVLSLDVDDTSNSDGSFATAADLVGLTRSNTVAVQAEPIDPKAVEDLRMMLTKGDREKAVWHAVDRRLWAHAMLLSSTLNKDIWKQVVQEFVRKEVKKIGRNNEALAVLYEIFAGNWEDCVDELVPASARAGFQMMSTDGAGAPQNALQGLDKWRETLSLILNNRSEGDAAALISLGKLLAGYGRVEASHICFIFARAAAYHGGADDPLSDIVLLGADHKLNPFEMGMDMEPILLTEVYEFALALSAPNGSHVIPHLQSYKLIHAYSLAENGYRSDAQAYCDSIAASMKSTTKSSPYYNAAFVSQLDDLSKRLSQSPKDGSSSWISKPSMANVSNSLFSKFTNFVAGDEEETAPAHPAGNGAGPFAKIASNSPTISPSPSGANLYGAYQNYGGAPAPSGPAASKYAPSNSYAPRTSLDQSHGRYEPQGRPSMESLDGSGSMRSPSFSGPYTPSQAQFSPPEQRTQGKAASYSPLRSDGLAPSYGGTPYQSTHPSEERQPSYGGYEPLQSNLDEQPQSHESPSYGGYGPPSISYEAPTGGYEAPTGGYEPPTGGYEPPSDSYNPDQQEDSPTKSPKKKKSFMDDDDDDDMISRAAALKNNKSDADRLADEAFRKVAEADAARDKASDKKAGGSGWFGGWFKKDPNAPTSGPIKAKLGEENSFYYDPELKKWVNKKAGATEATKPMATPPPPKSGPPSRSVSGNVAAANHALGTPMPPSSLPNAMSAPPTRAPTSNPQRSSSMPPPMHGGPPSRASTPGMPSDSEGKAPPLQRPTLGSGLGLGGSGPPSRPSTGLSNSSSIDDLLGAPTARKGASKKGKRGGRYIDVMAKP
ncbi:hypothetical protein P154DRAFT_525006 [Amniculicola lignicola CBS 123094]|uniref:Protein transport protein sec16 n=1 Tax=Amniculicola lignicola CBS 123094 TaxID=1392246 RepID=A0A6A5W8L9_9PLEO|nr:hypothetical protein P154DRAFT_525006 [Amniculicola lignicola CBS 123094]